MSIVVRFTPEKYDATQPLIEEAAGEWPPDGLEYHVAVVSGGDIRVSEIWDSKEQFEAFGEVLMPLLAANGVELAGPPEVFEVHNIIKR